MKNLCFTPLSILSRKAQNMQGMKNLQMLLKMPTLRSVFYPNKNDA